MRQLALTTVLVGLTLATSVSCASPAPPAETPAGEFKNLQFFPRDIARPDLIQHMRSFSFALGVRCQYCHAGGDGVSFEGVVFESDEKPAKRMARAMLQMTAGLNDRTLAALPERREPRVSVACVTCHRGLPVPMTLATHLKEIIASSGADAAVARYRALRESSTLTGRYDFGEWSMNELARELGEEGQGPAAIAILEMNGEFYPRSVSIDIALGELYAESGDRTKAAARYRAALEKDPQNQVAQKGLQAIER